MQPLHTYGIHCSHRSCTVLELVCGTMQCTTHTFFNPTPPPSPAGTPVIMRPRPGTCVSRQPVLGGGCVDLFPASSKSLNHYFLLETPTPTPTSTACGEILISAPNPNSDRLGNVWEISEKIGWNAPNPDPNRLTPTAWEISY